MQAPWLLVYLASKRRETAIQPAAKRREELKILPSARRKRCRDTAQQ